MTIEGGAILVTGANHGIGRALVQDALRRGAEQGVCHGFTRLVRPHFEYDVARPLSAADARPHPSARYGSSLSRFAGRLVAGPGQLDQLRAHASILASPYAPLL